MAKSGRRPPGDLRNTLGSLVASALEQVGVVREVVERGAQAQRSRYDTIRLDRRRREALASLGEVIYRLAVSGRLGPIADDPEVRAQLEEIDDIDQRRESTEQAGVSSFAANSGWQRGGSARRRHRSDDQGETRVWRPVPPFAAPAAHPDDDLDDLDDEPAPPAAQAQARRAPSVTGGGIRFGDDWDDEDDLEEYMHEDDVPPPAAPEPAAKEAEPEVKAPAKRRKRKPRKPKPEPKPE